MKERTEKCSDALSVMRVAGSSLPKSLQGVFWLQDQRDSSALCSFAQSNDGGKLSTGKLTNGDYQYSIRVGGDRVWSFHDKATSWKLVEFLDLIYNFRFTNDNGQVDLKNPTKADIIPESANLNLVLTQQWLLNFDMNLLKEDQKEAKYKDVVVWGRPSSVFGINVDSSYYELVQVIDGEGEKTDAFDDWVNYCKSDETGNTKGEFHFREATN